MSRIPTGPKRERVLSSLRGFSPWSARIADNIEQDSRKTDDIGDFCFGFIVGVATLTALVLSCG